MPSLEKFIKKQIRPVDFYRKVFDDYDGKKLNENVACPFHKYGQEENASFSIHRKTGKAICFTCGKKIGGVLHFWQTYLRDSIKPKNSSGNTISISKKYAAKTFYRTFIEKLVSEKRVAVAQTNLLSSPSVIRKMNLKKGIKERTLRDSKVGLERDMLIIPIYNEWGLCVNICHYNFKEMKRFPKYFFSKGYGERTNIYPIGNLFKSDVILITEGVSDCLMASQLGFNAITLLHGSRSRIKKDQKKYFKKKRIAVCYDNDTAGSEGAKDLVHQLAGLAEEIKIINLPVKFEKEDLSDYIKKYGGNKKSLIKLINKTAPMEIGDMRQKDIREENRTYKIPFDQISNSDYEGKVIKTAGLISGKYLQPYIIPKSVKYVCHSMNEFPECAFCDFPERSGLKHININDSKDSVSVLQMVGSHKTGVDLCLRKIAKIPNIKKCKVSVKVKESQNIEEIIAIPAVGMNFKDSQYVTRKLFYLGHGSECNSNYIMRGKVTANPKDQQATMLINKIKKSKTETSDFKLTKEWINNLEVFRSEGNTTKDVLDKLYGMAKNQQSLTGIYGRFDLNIAVNLVIHSPLSLVFNKEIIKKGWMDIMIIGDTRVGKGRTVERLFEHYNVGEFVSGENCSLAGLMGGIQKLSERGNSILAWGRIPQNDRKIIAIDEAKDLPFGSLSRIRSEGIAEIDKGGYHSKTHARTRLIFISNTKTGELIREYNSGLEILRELVPAKEDISRFDFVLMLSQGEVDPKKINKILEKKERYNISSDNHHALISWIYSLRPSQIRFSKRAVEKIFDVVKKARAIYAPTIPLIQQEDFRIKVARCSAALAGYQFNYDIKKEKLIVDRQHVEAFWRYINQIYSKPEMSYARISKTFYLKENMSLSNQRSLKKLMINLAREKRLKTFTSGLTELKEFTVTDISMLLNRDFQGTRPVINWLIRRQAIEKHGTLYRKTPAFTKYVKYVLNNSRKFIKKGREEF